MAALRIGGIDVFVEGDGAESIVMIHGWPDTFRLWDEQVAFFRQRYRCVRFTLPGFDVDKPRRPYSLEEMIDLLKEIIEHRSFDPQASELCEDIIGVGLVEVLHRASVRCRGHT